MFFAITGALSLIITVFSAVYVLGFYRKKSYEKRLSALSVFTMFFFVSIWVFMLPEFYISYKIDGQRVIKPLLLAFVNTIQMFIGDGNLDAFDAATENAAQFIPKIRVPYTLYASLLFVIAPILTFGNVLSLFKGFTEEIRFSLAARRKNVYIMSKLSDRSRTLAESICREKSDKTLIIFAGVDDSTDSELLFSARELNAVILRKSIIELDLAKIKKSAEIFLIGEDETENINRALLLTERLNSRKSNQMIKIFAFSHDRASGVVVDSADYSGLLEEWKKSVGAVEPRKSSLESYQPPNFRLRRVDIVRQFVWSAIQGMDFFSGKYCGKLSITIFGLGTYGLEFFKAVSWFCHLDKRMLEINLVDKNPDIRSVLNRHCQSLLTISDENDGCDNLAKEHELTAPFYNVRCVSGIDLDDGSFSELLSYSGDDRERAELSERLRSTTHAIVALGSDRTNTETAIYLRELFDRVNPPKIEKEITENTNIYSLLYSDCERPENRALRNYKGTPYNIKFIGGLSEKYSHETVCSSELEMEAFCEHVGWCKKMFENGSYTGADHANNVLSYERFEYNRVASISKAIYCKAISECLAQMTEEEMVRNEHNRWTLYMCSNNYINPGQNRNDRAKIHNLIVPFDKLPESEKGKDCYAVREKGQ